MHDAANLFVILCGLIKVFQEPPLTSTYVGLNGNEVRERMLQQPLGCYDLISHQVPELEVPVA